MRLEKAKPLLVTTDMKISEIALAVGYRNSKYFWNIFKRINGISPSDFRELHKG
jgi:two-component system response regulator YesN